MPAIRKNAQGKYINPNTGKLMVFPKGTLNPTDADYLQQLRINQPTTTILNQPYNPNPAPIERVFDFNQPLYTKDSLFQQNLANRGMGIGATGAFTANAGVGPKTNVSPFANTLCCADFCSRGQGWPSTGDSISAVVPAPVADHLPPSISGTACHTHAVPIRRASGSPVDLSNGQI